MTFKSITKVLLGTLMLVAASTSVKAQTPSIYSGGVIAYDDTTPIPNYYYWSIYGSDLSTVTQGLAYDSCPYGISSSVDFRFVETFSDNSWDIADDWSGCGNPSWASYFYESGSLINFYAIAQGSWNFTLGEYGSVTGVGGVIVYNSLGLESNTEGVEFVP